MHEQLLADLVAIFREEAKDSLDELRQGMEGLVDGANTEVLNECLRLAHNLKGASATVGFEVCSQLAFALEEFFLRYVDANESPSPELARAALEALAQVEQLVHAEITEVDVPRWRAQLGLPETSTISGAPSGRNVPAALLSMAPNGPSRRNGASLPPPPKAAGADQVESQPSARTNEAERPALGGPKPANTNSSSSSEFEGPTKFVRVDTQRLDDLLRLSSELLALNRRMMARRDQFSSFASELSDMAAAMDSPELGYFVERLEHMIDQERPISLRVGGMSSAFDDAMKRLRMTRLDAALSGWRRVVAEAGNRLHKEVRLVTDVNSIEVDKHVLERLQMPVIHVLRNAVAHGIEPPEERFEQGKPRRGEIRVSARLKGTFVVLTIADDGAGIDPRKVGRVAAKRGMLDPTRVESLSFAEAAELLFHAGFSTTARADLISGRGVGLADVRTAVEKLGGSVSVEQVVAFPGGTRFVLEFPVSVLSTRGLLVSERGQSRVIPLQNVERTLRVSQSSLVALDDERSLRTADGALVPFRTLAQLMGEGGEAKSPNAVRDVVLLESAGKRLAVAVDQVQWDQDVVIKPMPWNLKAHPHAGGIAQLADGSIALVVDPRRFGQVSLPPAARPRAVCRILVVDDSLTRRTLHLNLMRAAGYDTDSAADGLEAWDLLQQKRFDALVTDVQMPRLDGVELTKRVRASAALAGLPIVLVTGLTEASDEQRGMDAGANAYVRKQDFAQERLLETVSELLQRGN